MDRMNVGRRAVPGREARNDAAIEPAQAPSIRTQPPRAGAIFIDRIDIFLGDAFGLTVDGEAGGLEPIESASIGCDPYAAFTVG